MECPVNLTDIVNCQLVACELTKAFVCKWKNLNNYSLKILTVKNTVTIQNAVDQAIRLLGFSQPCLQFGCHKRLSLFVLSILDVKHVL